MTVTDANYEVAKEMLESRYDNRRAIVREHLSKIIHATPVTKQDPAALRSLWQGVDEQRRTLTTLGIQSHEMDIYTIHLVVDKLDLESRRQWELAHPGNGILTYLQLSEFLTTRCRALNPLTAVKLTQPLRRVFLGRHQAEHKPNKQDGTNHMQPPRHPKASASNATVEDTHCMEAVI